MSNLKSVATAVVKADNIIETTHFSEKEFYMTDDQILNWVDICNSDRARYILLDYIRLRALEQNQEKFIDKITDCCRDEYAAVQE